MQPTQSPQQSLADLRLVLVEPKFPENIGAAARIAANMGISQLAVVASEEPNREKMLMMATHKAAHLIDSLHRFDTLAEAVADRTFVIGTTARRGRQRHLEKDPRELAETILPLLAENRVALLFGPEHRGLTNEDLALCHLTSFIPTADFSSLNLAQAVAVYCHELHYLLLRQQGTLDRQSPRLAESNELEGMFGHIEELLARIGFLKTEDHTYWMRNIRHFLGRIGLRSREARIIRGFCRQFLWYETSGRTHKKEDTGQKP